MKCSIKRGLLDAYKRLMRNGDKGGVWDIIRHQEWRKNDVGTKSGCCSSLQHIPIMKFFLLVISYSLIAITRENVSYVNQYFYFE